MPESQSMRIAVASGKGGTGKTLMAVNLSLALAASGRDVTYADCDVEEPNGHLFLEPELARSETIGIPVPEVDREKCTACGECGRICRFSAIVAMDGPPLTFPELCKGCGGCALVCEEKAISDGFREVGIVETGMVPPVNGSEGSIRFIHGRLRIGEAQSPPLIQGIKTRIPANGITVFDSPPGTSCPVIETVRDSDLVLLVTEPTPFGLNDLRLAVEMARVLDLRTYVILNRSNHGNNEVRRFCEDEGLEIIFELPEDRRIAEACAKGGLVSRLDSRYGALFSRLAGRILELAP